MRVPIRWSLENPICDAYEVKNAVSSALHGHQHFLITLITRGEGVQTLNGVDIPFKPGDLFMLSPADFHKNTVNDEESYDYLGVKFPYDMLDPRLFEFGSLESFPIHISLNSETVEIIRTLFALLIKECNSGARELASVILTRSLLEELYILAIRELPKKAAKPIGGFVNRTLAYLYSNFLEEINVSSAAAFVGYTPNYFNTIFHQAFGQPFGAYLKKMRLDYARKLLLSSETSLTDVAIESGFSSLSHFSRSFSAEYGIAPNEYRKTKNAF